MNRQIWCDRRLPPRVSSLVSIALVTTAGLLPAGCAELQVENPVAELASPERSPRVHRAALRDLRTADDLSAEELQVLRRMIHRPGFPPRTREAALDLLEERDLAALKETIAFRLPRLGALQWRRQLCEIIADRGWVDLSPALARAWAYPISGWVDTEFDRPEYLALANLHGRDGVIDAVFDILLAADTVSEQGLKTSVWTLLIRLEQRDRLRSLLIEANVAEGDAMLRDLRAAVTDLDIMPANREEILWVTRLRQPEHELFWDQARIVVNHLPESRRRELELRDLAILVTVATHEPAFLNESKDALYERVKSHLAATTRHADASQYDGYLQTNNQSLRRNRDDLTWGDLAAMLMAVRAIRVPEMIEHLFDYAERDRADQSTEFGGIIRLDEMNRFEVIEFHPRVRYNDVQFQASDAMIEAAYTAIFHFHFHAQRHRNGKFAGPGFGDLNYADNTRANCLVLTFIDRDTIGVDYYRHGRVVVDLGEMRRR